MSNAKKATAAFAAALLASTVLFPAAAYARRSIGTAMQNIFDNIFNSDPFVDNNGEDSNSWNITEPNPPDPYPDNSPEEILTNPNFSLDSLNPYVVDQWKARPVNIPDSKLYNALLQYALRTPGTITIGDMLSLPSDLNLSNSGISDLSGLKYAINVLDLNISSNNISDLSELENLYRLQALDFSKNRVSRVPAFLFKMESLTSLSGSENGSTVVASITGTNKIKELYFNNNNFTSFNNLETCPNLSILNLSNNTLANVPNALAKLKNVEILDLSNNNLETIIQLENLTKLSQANFAGNSLKTFPLVFSQSAPLATLNLDENQISEIPIGLAELTSLEFLSLNVNNIKILPDFIASMSSLQILAVSLNEIDLGKQASTLKQIDNSVQNFTYKLQTPTIKLSLSKDGTYPVVKWGGLDNMSIAGEGELRVGMVQIERRQETLSDNQSPNELDELVNKYTVIQEMADTTQSEYIDRTAEKGKDYTYRVTLQFEGRFGSQTIDDSMITVTKRASAKINTKDMRGSSFHFGTILLVVGLLACLGGIGFCVYMILVRQGIIGNVAIVPKKQKPISDTTKMEIGKPKAARPSQHRPSSASSQKKRRFGEKANNEGEDGLEEPALDVDNADYTKIYR